MTQLPFLGLLSHSFDNDAEGWVAMRSNATAHVTTQAVGAAVGLLGIGWAGLLLGQQEDERVGDGLAVVVHDAARGRGLGLG